MNTTCELPVRTHLTINEATSYLAIGRTKLYALMGDGSIKAVKVGDKVLISVKTMDDFLQGLPAWKPASGEDDDL